MTIRAPYIKPPFDVPAIISTPLGSPGVLLAAIVAAAPFFNSIALGSATTFPDAASSAPQHQQRNPNLYPNPIPFAQYQWPRVTPLSPSVSRQAVFNSELFLNPIPFAQYDWSKPKQPPAKAADVYQTYGNFYPFTVVNAPFYQSAWPSVSSVKPVAPQASPYNSQIYTNDIPFNTRMSSNTSLFDTSPALPGTPAYNLNLYSATAIAAPFIPILWGGASSFFDTSSSGTRLSRVNFPGMYSQPVIPPQYGGGSFINTVPPQAVPRNSLVYSEVPFAQYDWSKPFQIAPRAADVYQPYQNFYPLTVIFSPFYQNAWPSVSPIKPVPPQATPYNAQLYTNPIPFAQYDWSKTVSIAPKAGDAYQPYSNFYAPIVVVMPFAQYDWPKVQPVKVAPPQLISVNYYVDFYSSPFGQTSWPQVAKPASSVALPFNFNNPLYFVQPPFNQNYWPTVQTVKSAPPQATPYNSQLYKNPLPFAQYQWPHTRTVKNSPPFVQPVVLSGPSAFFASNRIIIAGSENRVASAYREVRVAVTFSEGRVADAPKKDI